jgi:hypothetical protein
MVFETDIHTFMASNEGDLYKIQNGGLRKLAIKKKKWTGG